MIPSTFEQAVGEFQAAASRIDEVGVKAVDEALARLMRQRDARCIEPLLSALNDAADSDDGMFSIIHAAESFDDDIYVRELLAVLPELRAKASKWASIVLMRALNNTTTMAVLVRQLRGAEPKVKACLTWLCEKINERSPEFLNKTLPVLLAVK